MASEPSTFDADFLVLPGVVLPADAARLIDELAARGFSLERDGDLLMVSQPHHLTASDRDRLTRWRWHILAYIDRFGPVGTPQGTRQ